MSWHHVVVAGYQSLRQLISILEDRILHGSIYEATFCHKTESHIQGVSGGIVNIFGGSSIDYSE